MNLRGKTREEIELKLKNASRAELIDLIHSLVGLEIHLRASEVASRTGINKRAILRALRTGTLAPYLAIADNSIRIPISAVNQWLSGFRVSSNGKAKE